MKPSVLRGSIAVLIAVASASSFAQDTWTGATDANWSTPGNWLDLSEPTAGDAVLFPAPVPATGSTITLSTAELANSLQFASSYTLTGGDLTLTSGGITVDPTFTGTINSTLGGATAAINKLGAGTLVFGSANTYAGVTTVSEGVLNIRNSTALGTTAGGTTVAAGAVLELQGGITIGTEALALSGTLRNVSGNNIYGGAITVNAGSVFDIADLTTLTISVSTPNTGTGAWTKTGIGTLAFTADPNQTGPLTIAAGVVELNHGGATDYGTTIQSGATLRALTAAVGDGQIVTVEAGGTYDIRVTDTIGRLEGSGVVTKGSAGAATLTLNSTIASTWSGVIQDGAGQLAVTKAAANSLTWLGVNTYTGNTQMNTGNITVLGGGRLSAGGIVIVGDNNGNDESLTLGSAADVLTGTLDRVGDASTLRFNGTTAITYNGAAPGGATTETAAALDYFGGSGVFTINPAIGGEVQVNFGALTRSANIATGVIRGTGLGLPAGTPDSSRVLFATVPTVGLGGTGSSASIIPFLIGGSSSTAAPDTFLRYDAVNGVVPLGAGDYAATITGSAGQNVSLAAPETVTAPATINALRITPGGSATLNANVLVRSAAVLFTGDGTIDGTGTLTLGDGPSPGTIMASGEVAVVGTIGAKIVSAAGLSIGDAGTAANVILLAGNNDIYGGIVVNNGILRLGSAGALNGVFPNDLTIRAGNSNLTGANSSGLQLNGQNATVLFNGNDRLQGSTRIQNFDAATPSTLTIITNVNSDSNDGLIENGAGAAAVNLVKRGAARLGLEQNNSFTGTTEVLAGTLQLTATNGRLTGTTEITIRNGAILNLNNASGANQADRIANAAPITMQGGAFQFDNNQGAANYSETVGALRVTMGDNTVTTDFAAANQSSTLTFESLTVSSGASLNFQGFNTSGDIGIGEGVTRNRVAFTTAPTLTAGGIIGGNVYHTKDFNAAATQNVVNFASYGGTSNSVFAFAGYNTGTDAAWMAATVANPAADLVLTGNRTIEAIRLGGGIDLDIAAGQTLILSTGGLIHNGASSTITNGNLTAGSGSGGELAVRVEDNLTASTLTVSSVIANNGGPVSLLKSGADTLELTAANTYTGRTTVVGGILSIAADNNLGPAPATPTPGHLRLNGGTLNFTTGSATIDPNRGIEVLGGVGAITGSTLFTYDGTFTVVPGATLGLGVDWALPNALNVAGSFSVMGRSGGSFVSLAGANNVIGESLAVGALSNSGTLNYNVAGGVLTVGSANPGASMLDVGTRTNANLAPNVGVMDLTGSERLVATVDRVRIGVLIGDPSSDQNTRGTLTLGTNSTIMAATEVMISDSPNDSLGGHPSRITFGEGTNILKTPLLTVGGRKANGTLNIRDGGTLTYSGFGPGAGDLFIARNLNLSTGVTTTGTFDMTGGTLNADLDEIVIGLKSGTGVNVGGATGILTLGANAHNVMANSLRLGDSSGESSGTASGTLNLGGGSFLVRNDVSLGLRTGTAGNAIGTMNLTGGTMTVGGNIVTSSNPNATSTVNLDGGTLDLTGGNASISTFIAQSGALRNVGQLFGGDGVTPAALAKSGPVTLELGGTNDYTGATSVDGGILLVSGSVTGSAITVTSGTLGGTGSVSKSVAIGDTFGSADATLAPGLTGIGALTSGPVTFASDGAFSLEINSSLAANRTDLLTSTGSVSLGLGVVSLTGTDLGGAPLAAGQTFTFISAAGGVTGTFAGLADGTRLTVGPNLFTIEYETTTVSLVVVPEPGAILSLVGGAGVLVGFRRFRRF